jgi:hypothetical protein
MPNTIKLKNSGNPGVIPTPVQLVHGELAINYADGKLYYKKSDNTIGTITAQGGGSYALAGNNTDITSLTGITGNISTVSYVDFNLNSNVTDQEGRLYWNNQDNTLDISHSSTFKSAVNQTSVVPPCLNNSGTAIAKGNLVMATGSQGDKITIAKAVTNGTIAAQYMLGVAGENIASGQEFSHIITTGVVRDINTEIWPVGTVLYPDPVVAGGLTSVVPTAPSLKTPIAIVLRSHQNTGRIYVRMTWASGLGITDSNVQISNVQNQNVLQYNSLLSVWQNVQDLYLNGELSHKGLVLTEGNKIDQVLSITKTLTLTTDWQDTGIDSTDLETGTYIVQLYANDTGSGGTNSNEYYSGTMSWYSGQTNSSLELPTDEIVLHRAGGSGDGAMYLRTYRTPLADPSDLKLQIYSNTASASSSNYVFKFRKMI